MNQNCNHNKYEILDSGSVSCQPKYPLAQAPGSEFQQMNYKDWMNMCKRGQPGGLFSDVPTVIRNSLIIGTGVAWAYLGAVFPGASVVAGILNVLIPYLWPESAGSPGTPEAQFSWEQLMTAAETLINKHLTEYVRNRAITTVEGLQRVLNLYRDAVCDWRRTPSAANQSRVLDNFRITNSQFEAAMPAFTQRDFETVLLNSYAQMANLHLLFLQEGIRYGKDWEMSSEPGEELDDLYYQLLRRTAEYTDHCVRWYNVALQKQYADNPYDWNKFNNFRLNMTLTILDIIALWPTYDPKLYPVLTKAQLTRTVYTPMLGYTLNPLEPAVPIAIAEHNIVDNALQLFTWIRELEINGNNRWSGEPDIYGRKLIQQYTLSNAVFERGFQGQHGGDRTERLVVPSPQSYDDIWKIQSAGSPHLDGAYTYVNGWTFSFTKSQDQTVMSPNNFSDLSGLPCLSSSSCTCNSDPNTPCSIKNLDTTIPCNDKTLYSHRLSYFGAGQDIAAYGYKTLSYFGYGWTHISADANNLIDIEKITQIPAVKGYQLTDPGRVVRGPGSTGGDLVSLPTGGSITVKVTIPESVSTATQWYEIRMRYANIEDTLLRFSVKSDYEEWSRVQQLPTTYLGEELNFQAFAYRNLPAGIASYADKYILELTLENYGSPNDIDINTNLLIDKIEFIPIEGSLEAYQADQHVEKARKAVNALFTGDAKNALKLNVTDYAVDQAANLVECVSEDFHAQEKMIMLDQVKFAKRLSQARNLLNYGDFESPDWSGENGWKTSPHVHVASDNPIFKGRYLHMPGANQPQMSDTVYPTYLYQKVDESKLKSYTRYHVRGFVGNSKDLALLVERYGKEVHVEMDVPNDIRYTLPMNECGGFDRCDHSSYQAGTDSHTCTCTNPARMDVECQCKDKANRTVSDMYTNAYPDSGIMYPDGYHAHKSCGCGNNTGYQNGKHAHKSCGCKDPHVFSFHIDTGCVDMEENVGLLFALKIASTNGVANIDNLEIIEGQPLTGEALARVKKREHKWKQEMEQKRCKTEEAVQAAQTAINTLFTNTQYNRLKFETLFPHILHADELVQRIPYVYHPFLLGAYPDVPGMNYDIFQQLSALVNQARGLYDMRNLVRNGTFSAGIGNWQVTDGVATQPEGNTSVLILREWSDKAIQHLRIHAERGYVLRVTARKEGNGDGYVVIHDCDNQQEKLTFTACDYTTMGSSTGTQTMMTSPTNCMPCNSTTWKEEMKALVPMLSGYVTKTAEIFPDTDRIHIEIGETEGTFKIESVELICMEHMEEHAYDLVKKNWNIN